MVLTLRHYIIVFNNLNVYCNWVLIWEEKHFETNILMKELYKGDDSKLIQARFNKNSIYSKRVKKLKI